MISIEKDIVEIEDIPTSNEIRTIVTGISVDGKSKQVDLILSLLPEVEYRYVVDIGDDEVYRGKDLSFAIQVYNNY